MLIIILVWRCRLKKINIKNCGYCIFDRLTNVKNLYPIKMRIDKNYIKIFLLTTLVVWYEIP